MRVTEITTRIVRVIEVPRSQLADFLKMPEAQQVDVYFLIGELSEAGLPRLYIGQSGSVGTRLVQHNQSKDFWNRALVVISLTNSMTQTHALFLEWFAIQQATRAGRYNLENGNTGARRMRVAKSSCGSAQFLRASCPLQLRWTHAHFKSRNSNAAGRSSARALQ
jgi:predicted GIY-YIG superfamily endonuclease